MPRLNDFCTCSKNGDDFVGIRFENGTVKVHFPLGYFKNDDAIKNLSEDELRDCILNLFEVLGDESLSGNNLNSPFFALGEKQDDVQFPLGAYLRTLQEFLSRGYYAEREVEYKQGASGKISWGRTIKMTRASITDDEQNVVYLNPIARKVSHSENELITLVHKFCVHDASKRIGFIFGIEVLEEPVVEFNYELFASVLQSKISHTFNDRDLRLFMDLQKIVEFLQGNRTEDNSVAEDFYYGVSTFAPIWESMVEQIFGTERREDYYPNCGWVVEGRQKGLVEMRPDTVMMANGNLFILDSKFYSFGVDGRGLPQSESITKQLAYAEFAEQHTNESRKIYNAFIMPYCADSEVADSKSSGPFQMKYLGYAYSDWKSTDSSNGAFKSYHKIHGVLLDVKSVMQNYAKNAETQKELSDLIATL